MTVQLKLISDRCSLYNSRLWTVRICIHTQVKKSTFDHTRRSWTWLCPGWKFENCLDHGWGSNIQPRYTNKLHHVGSTVMVNRDGSKRKLPPKCSRPLVSAKLKSTNVWMMNWNYSIQNVSTELGTSLGGKWTLPTQTHSHSIFVLHNILNLKTLTIMSRVGPESTGDTTTAPITLVFSRKKIIVSS